MNARFTIAKGLFLFGVAALGKLALDPGYTVASDGHLYVLAVLCAVPLVYVELWGNSLGGPRE